MAAKFKRLKLSQLFLNPENYRFEPVSSQVEAIAKMIQDQGEKLYNLAFDILQVGLNPTDAILITPKLDGTSGFIVLEGNRRVTSLKLLCTPSLIGNDHVLLRKKFTKLKADNQEKIITELDCLVFDDINEADIWIKRKHSGELSGIGTVTWNSQQKQRFEAKTEGKKSITLQVIHFLQSHEYVPIEIKENLSKLNVTNLERLISDPYVREKLGLSLDNGIISTKHDHNEVIKGIMKIANDILSSDFKVSDIYNSQNRQEYIDNFNSDMLPNKSKQSEISWEIQNYNIDSVVSENISEDVPKEIISKAPKARKTLIPKSCHLNIIDYPKIDKIYHELQGILVYNYPNASSILLRVFIELSVDVYIEENNIIKGTHLTASASNESLQGKVNKVLNHMRNSKGIINDDLSKGIKAEINDNNSVISIESLNSYVHNTIFYTKADNLIVGWDTIQPFVEILWKSINKEKK